MPAYNRVAGEMEFDFMQGIVFMYNCLFVCWGIWTNNQKLDSGFYFGSVTDEM